MKKKVKVLELATNEQGNIEEETFGVKKGSVYKFEFDSSLYDVRVESEKMLGALEDGSFEVRKFGQTKVFFTNKESKEFSYVTLKCKNRVVPIFLPIITIGAASLGAYTVTHIVDKGEGKKDEGTTTPGKIEEYTEPATSEGGESSQGVIVFPSNVTSIGVSNEKPTFAFENSKYNRVFFHYYIYNKVSATTIDVGQVAPGEVLEFDIAKHFASGVTEVRIDIRTFKDTSETKERNSMSFNGVVIKK